MIIYQHPLSHKLPQDVVELVLKILEHVWIAKIQSMWRSFRTRKLVQRFRYLRFLKEFREWNPNVQTYLKRCK